MECTEISAHRFLIVTYLNVNGNENKSQTHLHSIWMCLCVCVRLCFVVFIYTFCENDVDARALVPLCGYASDHKEPLVQ